MERPKPTLGDIALALVLAAVGVLGTAATDHWTEGARPVDVWAFALVVPAALALSVRRVWPVAVLAVAAVAVAVFLFLAYSYGPIFFPFFVAVYTVARYRPLSISVSASVAGLPLLLLHLFTHPEALPGFLGLIPAAAWVVVPFSLGVTRRLVREAAERARAEEMRRGVDDERLRIAQEVHDVVGHGLAAIKVQADVALHLLAKKPEQAERALTAISRTSTEALDEVRATLSMVRGADSESERSPAPGLHQLGELRDRMADSGLEIDLDTTGSPRELPPAADLASYRVVQESLTNVLKHSAAKTAAVGIHYDADAVVIAVSNPAPAVPRRAGGGGHGIPGMRERVTALGGDLVAGPTAYGRFEVRATIPIGGDA